MGYHVFNSSFPNALCCDEMIANPVTCGFGPRALFSSPVLHRQVRGTHSKIQSRQSGVPQLWKNTSSSPGVTQQIPVCSWQGFSKSIWLEVTSQGDVSSHCLSHLSGNSTNRIWGRSRSWAVLFHTPNAT